MPASRPRGRPLSFDRDAALDRVLPVFWKKGFASASLDELAAAAGLNRPNLAAAFGDKRGLYLASMERFQARFAMEAGRALNEPGSLQVALERFFDFAVSVYAEKSLGCFVFGTAPAASGDDSEIQAELAKALQQLKYTLGQRLSQSIGRELGANADIPGLVTALSGVLLMLSLQARVGVPSAELCESHRRAVAAIVKSGSSR
jgi:TetR/AcrR family transcriptional regulator, copper-responsive repressor